MHRPQPRSTSSHSRTIIGRTNFAAALLAGNLNRQRCFSEFGRRAEENASLGTDHGTAGPVILVGPVRENVVGNTPSMTDLEDGDLKMQFDFRQVYACVLEDWLSIPSAEVLGGSFQRLKIV